MMSYSEYFKDENGEIFEVGESNFQRFRADKPNAKKVFKFRDVIEQEHYVDIDAVAEFKRNTPGAKMITPFDERIEAMPKETIKREEEPVKLSDGRVVPRAYADFLESMYSTAANENEYYRTLGDELSKEVSPDIGVLASGDTSSEGWIEGGKMFQKAGAEFVAPIVSWVNDKMTGGVDNATMLMRGLENITPIEKSEWYNLVKQDIEDIRKGAEKIQIATEAYKGEGFDAYMNNNTPILANLYDLNNFSKEMAIEFYAMGRVMGHGFGKIAGGSPKAQILEDAGKLSTYMFGTSPGDFTEKLKAAAFGAGFAVIPIVSREVAGSKNLVNKLLNATGFTTLTELRDAIDGGGYFGAMRMGEEHAKLVGREDMKEWYQLKYVLPIALNDATMTMLSTSKNGQKLDPRETYVKKLSNPEFQKVLEQAPGADLDKALEWQRRNAPIQEALDNMPIEKTTPEMRKAIEDGDVESLRHLIKEPEYIVEQGGKYFWSERYLENVEGDYTVIKKGEPMFAEALKTFTERKVEDAKETGTGIIEEGTPDGVVEGTEEGVRVRDITEYQKAKGEITTFIVDKAQEKKAIDKELFKIGEQINKRTLEVADRPKLIEKRDSLTTELEKVKAEADKLKTGLTEIETKIAEDKNATSSAKSKVKETIATIDRTQKETDREVKKKISETTTAIDKTKSDIKYLDKRISNPDTTLAVKDKLVAEKDALVKTLDGLKQKLKEQKEDVAPYKPIEELKQKLEEHKVELKASEERVGKAQKLIQEYKDNIGKYSKTSKDLESQIKEIGKPIEKADKITAEINSLTEQSKSLMTGKEQADIEIATKKESMSELIREWKIEDDIDYFGEQLRDLGYSENAVERLKGGWKKGDSIEEYARPTEQDLELIRDLVPEDIGREIKKISGSDKRQNLADIMEKLKGVPETDLTATEVKQIQAANRFKGEVMNDDVKYDAPHGQTVPLDAMAERLVQTIKERHKFLAPLLNTWAGRQLTPSQSKLAVIMGMDGMGKMFRHKQQEIIDTSAEVAKLYIKAFEGKITKDPAIVKMMDTNVSFTKQDAEKVTGTKMSLLYMYAGCKYDPRFRNAVLNSIGVNLRVAHGKIGMLIGNRIYSQKRTGRFTEQDIKTVNSIIESDPVAVRFADEVVKNWLNVDETYTPRWSQTNIAPIKTGIWRVVGKGKYVEIRTVDQMRRYNEEPWTPDLEADVMDAGDFSHLKPREDGLVDALDMPNMNDVIAMRINRMVALDMYVNTHRQNTNLLKKMEAPLWGLDNGKTFKFLQEMVADTAKEQFKIGVHDRTVGDVDKLIGDTANVFAGEVVKLSPTTLAIQQTQALTSMGAIYNMFGASGLASYMTKVPKIFGSKRITYTAEERNRIQFAYDVLPSMKKRTGGHDSLDGAQVGAETNFVNMVSPGSPMFKSAEGMTAKLIRVREATSYPLRALDRSPINVLMLEGVSQAMKKAKVSKITPENRAIVKKEFRDIWYDLLPASGLPMYDLFYKSSMRAGKSGTIGRLATILGSATEAQFNALIFSAAQGPMQFSIMMALGLASTYVAEEYIRSLKDSARGKGELGQIKWSRLAGNAVPIHVINELTTNVVGEATGEGAFSRKSGISTPAFNVLSDNTRKIIKAGKEKDYSTLALEFGRLGAPKGFGVESLYNASKMFHDMYLNHAREERAKEILQHGN